MYEAHLEAACLKPRAPYFTLKDELQIQTTLGLLEHHILHGFNLT